MIRDIPKILFFCACAVLLGVGLAKYAKADGYEPGMRGYKDGPSAYSYSHRTKSKSVRYRAICDRHMSAYECRRFREVMAKRAAGTVRKSRIVEREMLRSRKQVYYDRLNSRRYAETGYVRSDADYRGRRECKAPVMAEGDERGTRGRAESSASNAWRRSVVNRYGARFANLDGARSYSPECAVIRTNRLGVKIWICSVSARPCRED